ncbi:RNA polymerase sigma factor [Limnoglobus roseus]|uniref:Sigma-70 family RNA polymerase sigma factor n=1 Tax=Limnoglobus roseus TaxID=2598579 RepID=A0A5C1ADG7_9BACT|nr:sigma-70 family RNA polymerase sigma factor [Limnoglobus roseus]QEL16263.1 sigma-70 family RNA polymerase sigma factor [Limnoglobus roseus]
MFSTSSGLLERLRHPHATRDWDRFVDLYAPLLFAWADRLGVPRQDAADLVQDVFATLVEKLPTFEYDPAKSFRTWLKAVLHNRLRAWRRKGAGARRVGGDSAVADLPAAGGPDLDAAEYHAHLARRALDVMRADFTPDTWTACWEVVVNGRSAAAVAADLGLTVNAVYLAKARVLRRLREELAGLLD